MKRAFCFVGVAVLLCAVRSLAAEKAGSSNEAPAAPEVRAGMNDAAAPELKTTRQKREWLREQMVQGLHNARQIKEAQAQIDRMGPKEIDARVNALLGQQLPPNNPPPAAQQAQAELQRAQILRRMLEQQYLAAMAGYGYGRTIGYMPIITWLPQGTSFGASGVVSADGRYVRVSPMPFFSSVGPVYSYNLNTGETRLLPEYGYGGQNGSQTGSYQPPYGAFPYPYGYNYGIPGYPLGPAPPKAPTKPPAKRR